MRVRSCTSAAAIVLVTMAVISAADQFRLSIAGSFALLNATAGAGQPNAATGLKKAFMAVRSEGCADPSTVHVTATAEGIRDGARRSETLLTVPASPPGAFAVSPPPAQGAWVIVFAASCGNAAAGAIVPVTASGFDRDASTFYPRAATKAEVDAALKKAPVR